MLEEQWKNPQPKQNQNQDQSQLLPMILAALHNQFELHGVTIGSDYQHTCASIDDSMDPTSAKSCKSTQKVLGTQMEAVQLLLLKQLSNCLTQVMEEVFDVQAEEDLREGGINCLIIMQSLLKLDRIHPQDRNHLLKWIYELCCLNVMSMELSNVLSSIKKPLLKLGFSILGKQKVEDKHELNGQQSEMDQEDEQQFKSAVYDLIQAKEAQISGLKFELCRVCEAFMPINLMASHLNQCERIHQQTYLESKLDDKGVKLLTVINQLPVNSEQRYDLRVFFDRSFTSIGDVLATFALRQNRKQVGKVVQQYQKQENRQEVYGQILELLISYQQCLQKDDCRDNLSDKDSKKVIKPKYRRRNRCSIGSNTSLIPSFHLVQPDENSESSQEQQVVSSKTINTDTEALRHNNLSLSDFEVLQAIGKGSYSEVFLVRKKNTQDLFAMKVIQIEHLDQQRLLAFKRQQKIYKSITGGFNVKLYYSFGKGNLYFLILDYGCGGSLRKLLEDQVYFQQKYARVYLANLILAVDCIHRMGIVHRDLKPDNIVINEKGQLILTDFNLSKLIIDRDNHRSHTFFGTPDYIAPQVLRGQPVSHLIDYFSLGVIAYEITIGVTPFTSNSPQEVFDNILNAEIEWPQVGTQEGQISKDCKDLLERLLCADPNKRLGANGISQLQNHPFFEGVNWNNISQNQFFYVPTKPTQYFQNKDLFQYIIGKIKEEKEGAALEGDVVVRYDILKTITNKNVRSHRSSRFKLQKQLQALRLLPSAQSLKLKKHNSYNNFGSAFEDALTSCRELNR